MIVVALAVLVSLFFVRGPNLGPGFIFTVVGGLFLWRRFRNRRMRLARGFVQKAAKHPRDPADRARRHALRRRSPTAPRPAPTCARTRSLDSVNASMFFGEPFTLVIRDEFGPDEEKALLAGPGVLYVRETEPALLSRGPPPARRAGCLTRRRSPVQ